MLEQLRREVRVLRSGSRTESAIALARNTLSLARMKLVENFKIGKVRRGSQRDAASPRDFATPVARPSLSPTKLPIPKSSGSPRHQVGLRTLPLRLLNDYMCSPNSKSPGSLR
mgnify:FL=1